VNGKARFRSKRHSSATTDARPAIAAEEEAPLPQCKVSPTTPVFALMRVIVC
jgi:hypothetical protein